MKIDNIESTSSFRIIENTLVEDIKVLESAFSNVKSDVKINELIDSLINAKKKIIAMLPANNEDRNEGFPGPPRKLQFFGYRPESLSEADNQVKILNTLIDIESQGLDYVKSACTEKGFPGLMKDKMKEILNVYHNIVSQLNRSKSTQQLGTLII